MSPLAPVGARGYADYQRIVNFDSGVLWSLTGSSVGFGFGPTLDMSRYANLAGIMQLSGGQGAMQARWYGDAAATIPMGSQAWQMDSNIPNPMALRLPNLGPFCVIGGTVIGGGVPTITLRLFGSNHSHPLPFVPSQPVLLDLVNVALAANGTDTFYPSDYYAGPMAISTFSPQNGHLTLEYLTQGGTWDIINEQTITANTRAPTVFIAPPGAWRMEMVNDTANASSISLRATPSLTGSS